MMSIKKAIAALLAVLTICLVIPYTGAFAADDDFSVTIVANKESFVYGDTAIFTILVKNINVTGGLLSLDIPFRFDTNVFEFDKKTAFFPEEWLSVDDFSYSTPKKGLLWLRILDDSGTFTQNGCSRDDAIGFRVMLKVKENAPLGATTVTINGDGEFEVISGTAADGMCSEVGGTGLPVTVNILDAEPLLGDVNFDGYVDNLDAATVLKYDVGIINLSDDALDNGDMNGDGWVDNGDAAIILKIDAGLM